MKTKKVLSILVLFAAMSCSSCNSSKSKKSSSKTNAAEVYSLYCSEGGTLSYDDWVGVLNRGAKNKAPNVQSGSSAPSSSEGKSGDVYIDVENWDFYVKLGSEWSLMGNIRVEEQGLDYFLLNNDTYAVGLGKAKYLSNIVIPSLHFGKTVSMIADSFYPSGLTDQSFNIERTFKLPDTIQKIGQNAFALVPNKTTLDIPYSLEDFEKFDFASSWANSFVELKLTDRLLKISDVFDTLTVENKTQFELNGITKIEIKLSTTRFGGITQLIDKEDQKLQANVKDSICTVYYSSEDQSYIVECTGLGMTSITFTYGALSYVLNVDIMSQLLFDNAFSAAVPFSFETENYYTLNDKSTSTIVLFKDTTVRLSFTTVLYDFTLEYEFKVTLNGSNVNASDYIEETIDGYTFDENGKEKRTTNLYLKNFPEAGNTDTISYPRFSIIAKAHFGNQTQTKTAVLVLCPCDVSYKHISIGELYEKDSSTNQLKYLVEKQYGAFSPTDEVSYIETQGKLIYASPDGYWGILRDGNNFMTVYQLINDYGYRFITDKLIGKNVTLLGSFSVNQGNLCISYVKYIRPIKDGDTTHPVDETDTFVFDKTKLNDQEWWTGKMLFNQVGTIENATIVSGNIYKVKYSSVGQTTIEQVTDKSKIEANNNNYEFDVQFDSIVVTVAFNYHSFCGADGKGSTGALTELATNFLKNNVVAGNKINITGCVWWNNDRSLTEPAAPGRYVMTSGFWSLRPFAADHFCLSTAS